jgi:tetratricopeptide (TPR) repeat protein
MYIGVGSRKPQPEKLSQKSSVKDRLRGLRIVTLSQLKMKSVKTSIAFAVVLACCFARHAISQPQQSEMDSADRLFQSGKFAEAGKLYSKIVAQNPKDHSAILQLGRIALLSNRLDKAQKWFEKALALQPDDTDAKVMLAQAFYASPGVLSPRRFSKGSGCAQRFRRQQQQADH